MRTAQPRCEVCEMVVFYPTLSLARQIGAWRSRHADCRVEAATGRSVGEVRRAIDRASVALVDASDDYEQAVDAFAMALGSLGASKTAVYTEQMHEGLESFVRRQGVPLLFGPLTGAQWEGFFERLIPARGSPRRRLAA